MKRLPVLWVGLVLAGCGDRVQRVGEIEFFGYKGLDVEAVRAAVPIHEGDAVQNSSDEWKLKVAEKVKQVIGREPTDVSLVCCDSKQHWMVYIGLPGESSQIAVFNPTPTGEVRFPPEVVKLRDVADKAMMEAVMKGHVNEDRSNGYGLLEDPTARKKELEIRDYALGNQALILQVLKSSSDARHRAIAAQAVGYGRQSDEQVNALVTACLDPNDGVRNDATRALGVLAEAKPELAQRIPAGPFIRLLKSGTWTDHNKAAMVLAAVTIKRDSMVLGHLRAEALDTLIEMARWRSSGHAFTARMLLGRIGGIEEKQLEKLALNGPVDTILASLTPAR